MTDPSPAARKYWYNPQEGGGERERRARCSAEVRMGVTHKDGREEPG
eukprot:CAMPEP_0114173986 /NCGR_PEP_ID=MMETSP0043_2-20121206/36140_1 /TAXON_ID=464988 /ORGANISM="Hemiselmis andersenii, Strain CCMP644" /LENGTH=46 /DNA_ID= /DNA_START= /DNA_END= /DNA_ORIENTATION=